MTETSRARLIEELEREELDLVLPRFEMRDAWRLGSAITERALTESLTVAIDIRRHAFILFRASLVGSTPDQEEWIRRKSATALRMETSTLLLRERFAAMDLDPAAIGWLEQPQYAIAGGSVPLRVAGVGVVATATVSGLTDELDHELVVDGVRGLIAELNG